MKKLYKPGKTKDQTMSDYSKTKLSIPETINDKAITDQMEQKAEEIIKKWKSTEKSS